MFSKSQRFADRNNKNTPGPGEYDVKLLQTVTNAAFPKEQRFSDSSDTEGLGPGAYGPPVVGKPKKSEFKVPTAKQHVKRRSRKAVAVQTNSSHGDQEELSALQTKLNELRVKYDKEREEQSSRIAALQAEHNSQASQLKSSLEAQSQLVSQLQLELSDASRLADSASAEKVAADVEVVRLQLISDEAMRCQERLRQEVERLSTESEKEHLRASELRSKLTDAQDEKKRLKDSLAETARLLTATKDEMAERIGSLQKAMSLQDETIASLTVSVTRETELRLATEASLGNKSETITCLRSTVEQLQADIREWESLHNSHAERQGRLEEQVTSTSSSVSTLTAQLGHLQLANEEFRAQTQLLQRTSQSSAETVQKQEQTIRWRDAEIDALKEKLALSSRQQELVREKEAKIEQLLDLNNLLSTRVDDYESMKSKVECVEHLMASMKEKQREEISTYDSLLAELKVEKQDTDIELSELKKELNQQKSITNDLQQQYSDRITSLQTEVGSLRQHADTKRVEMEKLVSCLESENDSIKSESRRIQVLYSDLQEKIAPFREQLDAFELERRALEGRSKNWESEAVKATQEYAKLLGHQNQKQRIKRIDKISEENFTLKQEVMNMRSNEAKIKRQVHQLQEKVRSLEGKKRFDPSQAFKGREDKGKRSPLKSFDSNNL